MRIDRRLMLTVAALLALAACSSGSSGSGLAHKVLPLPLGYNYDTTAGATGQMSPQLFSQYGGAGSASSAGFVVGFRQNYVDQQTAEGITVTVLQFSSDAAASRYLQGTANHTLAYAAPAYKPYPLINGAVEVDGTQPYQGEYVHGVLMARNVYYASVVYVATGPGPAPIELGEWSRTQYAFLK